MDLVVTNAATDSHVALHTGSDLDPALLIVNAQGFKDLNIWHPVDTYGLPSGFGRDFMVMGPTTVARPVTYASASSSPGSQGVLCIQADLLC